MSDEKEKRKKKIKYIIGGTVVGIVILIAIILGVVLGKDKSIQPTPDPTPTPTPSVEEGYNMYKGTISEENPSGVQGIANFVNPKQLKGSQSLNISTHPQNISIGYGNNITNQIKWSLQVTGLK